MEDITSVSSRTERSPLSFSLCNLRRAQWAVTLFIYNHASLSNELLAGAVSYPRRSLAIPRASREILDFSYLFGRIAEFNFIIMIL